MKIDAKFVSTTSLAGGIFLFFLMTGAYPTDYFRPVMNYAFPAYIFCGGAFGCSTGMLIMRRWLGKGDRNYRMKVLGGTVLAAIIGVVLIRQIVRLI